MTKRHEGPAAAPEQIPFHPVANEYPLMGEAELEVLAGNIAERGLELPVVRRKHPGHADHGDILDGRNRYLACLIRGIDPRYEWWDGADEELRDFVDSMNLHRRHLTPEQLERRRADRIPRVAAARAEGKSLRQIAEQEGISHEQVRQDLEKALVNPLAPEPGAGKVTGKDGKKYPARKKTAAKKEGPKADGPPPGPEQESEAKPDESQPLNGDAKDYRKKAKVALGVLVRCLDGLGLYEKHRLALEAVNVDVLGRRAAG